MMKRDIELVRRALRFLYEFLFSALIAEFVIVIFFKSSVKARDMAILLLLYIISYAAREKSGNLFVMLLCHILPAVCLVPLGFGAGYITLYAVFLVYLADASYMYVKRNMVLAPVTDFPWVTFLFCIIIYIYGYYTDSLGMIKGVFFIPAALVFLYLTSLYTDGLGKYVASAGNIEGLPLKSIIITNSSIVGAVLLLLLTLIIISKRLSLDLLIKGMIFGAYAVIKVLWTFLSFLFAVVSSMITTGSSNIETYGGEYGERIISQSGRLADFAEVLIIAALLVLFICLLVKAGRYIVSVIFVRYRHLEAGDVTERAPVKKHITREKLRKRHIERLDLTKQIRRLYKNFILRHKNDVSLDGYKTSRNIESDMEKLNIVRAHEITDLYCSVRYGKKGADKETLREMKRLIR